MKTLTLIICSLVSLLAPTTEPTGEKYVTPSGITIISVAPGGGTKIGDTVYVLYTGKVVGGKVFDSTAEHNNEPITFKLGAGSVIKGWEEGLQGMQIGEKRKLIIPPNLAFGTAGRGDKIPPNSTVEFDVELVGLLRT